MKKAIKIFLIVLVIIVCLPFLTLGALWIFVPISRPNNAVCSYVLTYIPKGTSWDDTLKIIEKRKWTVEQTELEYGLLLNDNGAIRFATDESIKTVVRNNAQSRTRHVGVKAMCVELGEFYAPFHTAVFAYIAFDENDELVEVAIRRYIDSL